MIHNMGSPTDMLRGREQLFKSQACGAANILRAGGGCDDGIDQGHFAQYCCAVYGKLTSQEIYYVGNAERLRWKL